MLDITRTGSYCVKASTLEAGVEAVTGALAAARAPHQGEDFLTLQKTTISIDDIRAIQQFHEERSVSGQKSIICAGSFITTQAQNALLKMIEDTKQGERIFLIVGPETELLPTILSRVQMFRLEGGEVSESIGKFVSEKPHVRLKYIEDNILNIEESDQKRDTLLALLRDLESYLHGTSKLENYQDILKALPTLRHMLANPGAPVKMIAEYVALGF